MTLTSDQYLQLAKSYDEAARDPSIAAEKREAFAKKGRWFRFLAAREGEILELKEPLTEDRIESVSRRVQTRGLRPFLTTLWLSGAAIYLLCTVLLTNTVTNFFSPETREARVADGAVASDAAKTTDESAGLQPGVPLSDRSQEKPHAIDPNEPRYEAPGLVVPPSTTEASQNPITALRTDQISTPLANEPEVLRLSASATIRNGPSQDAKVIGTASPGAELEVKRRENGWVQFVDPSSGNSGWIESQLLAAASPTAEMTGEPPGPAEAQAPNVEQPKPKAAKKRVQRKATEPAQVAKQRPDRPASSARNRAHAALPRDEAFIDTRVPRRGFFARRRMLREGLLSPDFTPP